MSEAWSGLRETSVRGRLLARARHSVERHRDYRTLRREDRRWDELASGCRRALLSETPQGRVALVHLARGAALPWGAGVTGQEVLVVEGTARALPAGGPTLDLPRLSFGLRRSAEAGRIEATDGPATLYVREIAVDPATLPEPESTWWALARGPFECVLPGQRRWVPTFPGVEVLPLWGNRDVTSMLVRFAPGAGVPDHRHAVHEDCLMLEGEMFLGDILLRPGDYQLAPAGGGHFGEMSDVGGTFFFHGAIDPVLIPAR
jgi:hypothetical protein